MTLPDPSPLALRAPLVYWEMAWVIGYAAAQFLSAWLAYLIWFGFMTGWLASRRV